MARGDDPGVKAWEALLRTHAALVKVLADEVEETTGLPLSWYDVLLELNRVPQRRLRMTELGERVVLSRSRVSRMVDAMAIEGLVEKEPDPDDGRATFAVMTIAGRTALRSAAPVYLAGIDRHFSKRLAPSEAGMILRALNRILAKQNLNGRT